MPSRLVASLAAFIVFYSLSLCTAQLSEGKKRQILDLHNLARSQASLPRSKCPPACCSCAPPGGGGVIAQAASSRANNPALNLPPSSDVDANIDAILNSTASDPAVFAAAVALRAAVGNETYLAALQQLQTIIASNTSSASARAQAEWIFGTPSDAPANPSSGSGAGGSQNNQMRRRLLATRAAIPSDHQRSLEAVAPTCEQYCSGAVPRVDKTGRRQRQRQRHRRHLTAAAEAGQCVATAGEAGPNGVDCTGCAGEDSCVVHASDMQMLTWDAKLAGVAEAYAKTCPKPGIGEINRHRHEDYIRAGGSSPNGHVGENIAWVAVGGGEPRLEDFVGAAMARWQAEAPHLGYSATSSDPKDVCAEGHVCRHYQQLIWGKTGKLGCGHAECPTVLDNAEDPVPGVAITGKFDHVVVCNYAAAGNYRQSTRPVFKAGMPCADCGGAGSDRCVDNLCVVDAPPGSNDGLGRTVPAGGSSSKLPCPDKVNTQVKGSSGKVVACDDADVDKSCQCGIADDSCPGGKQVRELCPAACGTPYEKSYCAVNPAGASAAVFPLSIDPLASGKSGCLPAKSGLKCAACFSSDQCSCGFCCPTMKRCRCNNGCGDTAGCDYGCKGLETYPYGADGSCRCAHKDYPGNWQKPTCKADSGACLAAGECESAFCDGFSKKCSSSAAAKEAWAEYVEYARSPAADNFEHASLTGSGVVAPAVILALLATASVAFFLIHRSGAGKMGGGSGAKAPAGAGAAAAGVAAPADAHLWRRCTSPDGRTYYFNTETEETSWEAPAGMDPLSIPMATVGLSPKSAANEHAL